MKGTNRNTCEVWMGGRQRELRGQVLTSIAHLIHPSPAFPKGLRGSRTNGVICSSSPYLGGSSLFLMQSCLFSWFGWKSRIRRLPRDAGKMKSKVEGRFNLEQFTSFARLELTHQRAGGSLLNNNNNNKNSCHPSVLPEKSGSPIVSMNTLEVSPVTERKHPVPSKAGCLVGLGFAHVKNEPKVF